MKLFTIMLSISHAVVLWDYALLGEDWVNIDPLDLKNNQCGGTN